MRENVFIPEAADRVVFVLFFQNPRIIVDVVLEVLLRLLLDHVGGVALQRQSGVAHAQKL